MMIAVDLRDGAAADLDGQRLRASSNQRMGERHAANIQTAIEAAKDGTPTHVIDGRIFWGAEAA